MRFMRLKAITRKEMIQIFRDPLSLLIAFLMPLMQLFIYGYAISFDVNNITTVVYDQDKSSMSRELIAEFRESGYFTVVDYITTYRDIDTFIDTGMARVAILIPRDFSRKVRSEKDVHVGVLIDGSDSNTATIAEGYIAAISRAYGQRIRGVHIKPLIDSRTRVWYNPELKSRNFIIPGLIVVIMAVIIALLTSLTIAREWERGTMEQLISTPVKVPELIIGKLIPYFLIGFTDIVVAILMGIFWFKVLFKGDFFLLIALSGIFLFGGVSFGVLISIIARGSQSIASQMALLSTFLPSFLLSGFIFAITNMPKPLQLLTYIVPARYFVTISKGIFLKGSSLKLLITEVLILTVYGAFVFTLANRKFRKRIE